MHIFTNPVTYIELFGKKRVWPPGMSSAEIMQKICGSYGIPPVAPTTNHLTPSQQFML